MFACVILFFLYYKFETFFFCLLCSSFPSTFSLIHLSSWCCCCCFHAAFVTDWLFIRISYGLLWFLLSCLKWCFLFLNFLWLCAHGCVLLSMYGCCFVCYFFSRNISRMAEEEQWLDLFFNFFYFAFYSVFFVTFTALYFSLLFWVKRIFATYWCADLLFVEVVNRCQFCCVCW